MRKPKISLLTATCTVHTLARSRILAQLLATRFEVEVIAPAFAGDPDDYGDFPWPCRYRRIPVRKLPAFAHDVSNLVDAISGDVVYASKPRMASFGVALLARLRRKVPVVVDFDDREIYQCYPYSKYLLKNLALSVKHWTHPNAYPLTLAMEHLVGTADYVTSVSSYFQRLFGGTIVPQAVDTDLFNPDNYDREALRRRWGLDKYRVILFSGRPLPHKGLADVLAAVEMSHHCEVRLVLVGGYTSYVDSLREREKVIFLGPQPFNKGPEFLTMADVVMLPQRASPLTFGQMPVKLVEAMAMRVPVITTAISDLVEQVGDGGIVVPPGDVSALAQALDQLLEDEDLAATKGRAARQRAIERYSVKSVGTIVEKVFEPYVC